MKQRFSKKWLIDKLIKEMEQLEKQYDFTTKNGCAQVDKRGERINRAYGRYAFVVSLIEDLAN